MTGSRTWAAVLGLGLIATALAVFSSVATATSGTVWSDSTAIIFDNGVHSSQGGGEVKSVSCFSAGDCTAVGEFTSPSTHPQAFAVSSVDGVWGAGVPTVFGSGIRYPTGESELVSVSCAAVGYCVAVGSYYDPDYRLRPFLVVSAAGTWGSAVPVTFPASVESAPPNSNLIDVDCTSTGNCTALGRVRTQNGSETSFTISSTSGTWGAPTVVTFPDGVLPTVHRVYPHQLSCASAGNCTVVGTYYEADNDYQAFASTSVDGAWGPAETIEFPPNTLNSNAEAELMDVSCPAIGSCTATGYFANTDGDYLGFTVTATSGDWSMARPEPAGHFPNAIHCASAGNCTAVGDYAYTPGRSQSYTTTSTNGQWGSPAPVVFGAGVQNDSPNGRLDDVSCPSPGNCTAIGFFSNTDGIDEGFTISSVDGVWTDARPAVFQTGTGNVRRPSYFRTVDCPTNGLCTAGGRFTPASGHGQIFVMSSSDAPPTPDPATPPLIFTPPTAPTTQVPVSSPPTTDAPPPALSVIEALSPAPTPLVPVDRITVGSPITVSYGGFTPLEFVQLVVASTPQVIGSGFADSRGVVTLSGNLPTNLSSGQHTLAVYAPGSGVGFSQAITVASATLPVTGSQDSTEDLRTATWMVAIGATLIIAARQRRRV